MRRARVQRHHGQYQHPEDELLPFEVQADADQERADADQEQAETEPLEGDEEAVADWSTGKVGMTGTSYNGTIPVAAATEEMMVVSDMGEQ